jgi:DNA-binding protein HU-beta
MKKNELVSAVSGSTKVDPKVVSQVLESIMHEIQCTLFTGETVHLRGFANFSVKRQAPKLARNITKGTEINIPARYVPKCKFAIEFREQVIKKVKI